MTSPLAVKDYEDFGRLIRRRRQALGLSQEALATEALGNPDRKSFVSAIENNRLSKITPSTAQRLSGPLGLVPEDLPAALRWPTPNAPAPTEERLRALEAQHAAQPAALQDSVIAYYLNTKMVEVLHRSMSEVYRDKLIKGLSVLQIWTGRPFGLQSLLACFGLSLFYVVTAGVGSFLIGEISIGDVRLFRLPPGANAGQGAILPYLGLALLALSVGVCCILVRPFGKRPLTAKQTAARLGCVALVAGVACGVVDYMGTRTMTAAVLFTVPSCAAISTLTPKSAALYGAVGGVLFGLAAAISSGLTDATMIAFLTSLSEGFIIGGLVGLCAGLASSLIARRLNKLRPGQLAAAGGGVAVGSLVSLAGIVAASPSAAMSGATLGLFSLSWVALPMANAALDYLSLGISHALGRYIVTNSARTAAVLVILVLDLALAIALMVFSVGVIGLTLGTVTWGLGVETLSNQFLQTSAADPWGQGIWLTLMVLSTTSWTLLHFAFVVAPLAAGALTQRMLEKPAAKRLGQALQNNDFDVSVGMLVTFRAIFFYLCWGCIALLPLMIILTNPGLMQHVLWLGWQVSALGL